MTRLTINTTADIQSLMEEHGYPMGLNTSQFMVALMQTYYDMEQDVLEIWFKLGTQVLPDAYERNPHMWANAYSTRVPFQVLQARKEGAYVVIRGASKAFSPRFANRLVADLLHNNTVTYKLVDIPASYQTQPFTLVSKLKEKGHHIRVVRITATTITYAKRTISKPADNTRQGKDDSVLPSRGLTPVGGNRGKRKDAGRIVYPKAVSRTNQSGNRLKARTASSR